MDKGRETLAYAGHAGRKSKQWQWAVIHASMPDFGVLSEISGIGRILYIFTVYVHPYSLMSRMYEAARRQHRVLELIRQALEDGRHAADLL